MLKTVIDFLKIEFSMRHLRKSQCVYICGYLDVLNQFQFPFKLGCLPLMFLYVAPLQYALRN